MRVGSAPALESETYRAVVEGIECGQSRYASGQLDCDYRMGKAVHFTIAGVGEDDASITFVRADSYDRDYYVSFGVLHGCVIVKPGQETNDAALRRGVLPGMAFVSPLTGRV